MPPPKKRPPLTHFLCLPLTGGPAVPQWRASLRRFGDDVAADCAVGASTAISGSTTAPSTFKSTSASASASASTPNSNLSTTVNGKEGEGNKIPVKAIRPLGTLHLTIGVMSLKEERRVEGAVECLRGLDLGGFLGGAKQTTRQEGDVEQRGKYPMDTARREMSSGDSATKAEVIDGKSILSTREAMQPPEGSIGTGSPPPPLTLSFTGLKSMQSPKSTSFLYVPPTDTTGRLYPFCQSLRDHFTAEGFIFEEDRALKLHATILNTIYAGKVFPSKKLVQGPDGRFGVAEVEASGGGDEEGGEHHEQGQVSGKSADEEELLEGRKEGTEPKGKKKGERKKQVVKFDARELMKRYVDFVWAQDVRIEKVAICEMGAKKMTDEKGEVVGEEYTEVASFPLP